MHKREKYWPALRPADVGRMCVVMACSDMQEADQVGRHLAQEKTGCLVTYLRSGDLLLNSPSGEVVLVILATDESVPVLRKALGWLRRRWPNCPITVVGDVGCGEHEMAAREGGATFLTRPVEVRQWAAIVAHAFRAARQHVPKPSGHPTTAREKANRQPNDK